jgi:hypothetical protein
MVLFFGSSRRKKLLKSVKSHFRRLSWRVEDPNDDKIDLYLSKRDFRFPVACFDETLLSFVSANSLLDRIERNGQYLYGSINRTLVAIVDWPLTTAPLATLADKQIAIFHESELGLISACDDMIDGWSSTDLDPRQKLLLQGNIDACLTISSRLAAEGNRDDAIEWAKLVVSRRRDLTVAHVRLHALLHQSKRLDEADDLAEQSIRLKPSLRLSGHRPAPYACCSCGPWKTS